MPVLLEEVEIQLDNFDLMRRLPRGQRPAPRSKGLHLSGILRPLAIAAKQLRADSSEDLEERAAEEELPVEQRKYKLLWAVGLMWEEFAASLYPDMDYQPGEVEKDGVWMTCDGLNVIELPNPEAEHLLFCASIVEEFKATYAKVKTGAEFLKDWLKMQQGRGYCAGYGPRLVRWHVLYLRGNYQEFGPVYKRFLVEFSEKEIEMTWRMVKQNKAIGQSE